MSNPPYFPFSKGGFKDNVVAQFIGQLCLMNQATTKSGGRASSLYPEQAPQSHPPHRDCRAALAMTGEEGSQ